MYDAAVKGVSEIPLIDTIGDITIANHMRYLVSERIYRMGLPITEK